MRLFTCLTDPEGRGISDSARREYESLPRARGLAFEWGCFRHAAVLTAGDGAATDGEIATNGAHLAVGTVRLDNPRDLEQWTGVVGTGLSDLELVLRVITQCGFESVPRLLGDFAFVYWDAATRTGVAACDALSVRKLYYAERHGLLAFSSRAEALAQGDRYNVRFLAEQVAACDPTPELSVYEGVATVPAGTMLLLAQRSVVSRRYWSAEEIDPARTPRMQEQEASEALRELLIEAVRSRMGRPGETWAQLSGGVDSSSLVSLTQWLVERGELSEGLAGTVTYVDRAGTPADERAYSQVIGDRWRVPNCTIVDPPLWYDQHHAPPHLDQPRQNFMFYPREYLLAETVLGEGGRVLLSGQGPDEYLRGSMYFFADWIAQGRVGAAVREMVRRAAIGRASFWELAYRNVVVPLMPRLLRRSFGPDVTQLQPWVRPGIVQRYGLRDQVFEMTLNGGRWGQKYRHTMSRSLITLTKTIGHLVVDDLLDVRHPFLDRRLVEFGLGLRPELTTRPHAGKWLLREAMRGIVPEAVRTRVGKGSLNERHAWSLSAQRTLLAPLVQQPILADLGVVDGGELRAAFDRAPQQAMRRVGPHSALQQILAIEAWLQLRAGRWPRGATNAVPQVTNKLQRFEVVEHSGRTI